MRFSALALFLGALVLCSGQEPGPLPQREGSETVAPKPPAGWKKVEAESKAESNGKTFVVQPGTKILLSMINSISTRSAVEGVRVYLETMFPVLIDGRIVVPPGSYVAGTVTQSKRPGRIKGRGELYVRFDSLTLPNGVTREFRSRIGSLDGRAAEDLDKDEGRIKSEGNKSGDARTVGEAAAGGASVGALGGAVGGRPGMGAGIGAAAGAAAGLVGVLLTRGPDAVLAKGTSLEMILDRPIAFDESELNFNGSQNFRRSSSDNSGPLPSRKNQGVPYPGRVSRFPY